MPGFSGSSWYECWTVWIDLNGDGEFDNEHESVFSAYGNSLVEGYVPIPMEAIAGPARMRVSMRYYEYPLPCGWLDYGEVEDYTVYLSPKEECPYAASKGLDQNYEWIDQVECGRTGIQNHLDKKSDASGYSDFTFYWIRIRQEDTVDISLTPGFTPEGSSYPESWKVWIDYNGDGDFSANEMVFNITDNKRVSGKFTVPTIEGASSSSFTTRMRVSMRYKNPPSPEGDFLWGEVEDYTVWIDP